MIKSLAPLFRLKRPVLAIIAAAVTALPLTSCKSSKLTCADLHILATDSDAFYYDHRTSRGSNAASRVRETEALEGRLKDLQAALDSQPDKTEILVFVHGGMNHESAGIGGARAKFEAMQKDEESKHIFPVFVTWDSGLGSSYLAHLIYEEKGISYRNRTGLRSLGVAKGLLLDLPTDVARGLVTAPLNTFDGMVKSFQNSDALYSVRPRWFPTRYTFGRTIIDDFNGKPEPSGSFDESDGLWAPPGNGRKYAVSMGRCRHSHYQESALNLAFSPSKAALSPFYEGLGTPAWQNMTRRSHTLVTRYPSMQMPEDGRRGGRPRTTTDGVLSTILASVSQWQQQRKMKVTLVGHSMGAMVLNDAFRALKEKSQPPLRVDRIIYMAAACSIRDFKDGAGRYMMENPRTELYNLCLHPHCEVGESQPFQKVPLILSGSLLIWIDEFFEGPRDFLDRTLGSFENAIIAHNHLPNTSRFHLKAFGQQGAGWGKKDAGPQIHGAFGKYRFWKQSFLEPVSPGLEPSYTPL